VDIGGAKTLYAIFESPNQTFMVHFPFGTTVPLWEVVESVIISLPRWIVFFRNKRQRRISIIVKRLPLKNLLLVIEELTGYTFSCEEGILEQAKPVTIYKIDATIDDILNIALCFQVEPFTVSINGKKIILKRTMGKWQRQ
jgi:hypothetical protein